MVYFSSNSDYFEDFSVKHQTVQHYSGEYGILYDIS